MTEIGLPPPHKTTHQDGGSDEIDLTGLAGAATIEDSPVNGHTAEGISSNWAYDHKADPVAHHAAVDPGEGRIFFFARDYHAIVAGTWAFSQNSGYWLTIFAYNDSNADGDEINYKAYLTAGTYTLVAYVHKAAAYGIAKILIDDVVVGTFDLYDASTLNNQVVSQASIVVASSGLKTIKLKCDGKNGSSTGYYVPISAFTFFRSA